MYNKDLAEPVCDVCDVYLGCLEEYDLVIIKA